ncbi:uncharacterized protein RAG0_16560 [Rhynchosporium agropyri]|uniref:Uncharacterized protein n=1 Tax=Rhynchosporium agropyri TaxID=914238 RepID=A0A1E1LQW4_9HELO|nr:uncharacterized protein RAG0_16560 [Rhynchosporium agropyri]
MSIVVDSVDDHVAHRLEIFGYEKAGNKISRTKYFYKSFPEVIKLFTCIYLIDFFVGLNLLLWKHSATSNQKFLRNPTAHYGWVQTDSDSVWTHEETDPGNERMSPPCISQLEFN